MNELYWITRLDSIESVFIALLVFAMCGTVISIIGYFVAYAEANSHSASDDYKIECANWMHKFIYILKISLVGLFIGILGDVFIPNTKETLLIYGVSSSIDYIKENPTAK